MIEMTVCGNDEFMVWQVGEVKVTRVLEMVVTGDNGFVLPDASNEKCLEIDWLHPHFMDEQGYLSFSVHALIVDTGTRRIVVDTCIGNDKELQIPGWGNLQSTFLDDMAAAGYPADSIDTVLCTHLHVDHVGWNTMKVEGAWVPTFPRARYLVARREWEFWDATGDEEGIGPVMADSVRPIVDAGLMDLIDVSHQVCPEVRLEPTHGHTPGHVSVHISSAGQEALITGDCIHHPVQMARAEWCSSADADPDAALTTRKDLLARYAGTDTLVIGTHFPTPTAGHIRSAGSAGRYWFEVESGL